MSCRVEAEADEAGCGKPGGPSEVSGTATVSWATAKLKKAEGKAGRRGQPGPLLNRLSTP